MFKSAQYARITVSVFICAVAFWMVSYQENKEEQSSIQKRALNRRFAKVQLQNEKVLLVPSDRARYHYAMGTVNGEIFDKPMLFSVGSHFKIPDHHFPAKYTITSIEPDGVWVHFNIEGHLRGEFRRSHGAVKLQWK